MELFLGGCGRGDIVFVEYFIEGLVRVRMFYSSCITLGRKVVEWKWEGIRKSV